MNRKTRNPTKFYNVNKNTATTNNNNNNNNNNSNNNNNNNKKVNKVSAYYCFGILSSKRSLDQRADPI